MSNLTNSGSTSHNTSPDEENIAPQQATKVYEQASRQPRNMANSLLNKSGYCKGFAAGAQVAAAGSLNKIQAQAKEEAKNIVKSMKVSK